MWNCNLCKSKKYSVIFNKVIDYEYGIDCSKFSIVKCERCSFISLNPIPTKKKLLTFYPKNYHNYAKVNSIFMEYLDKIYRAKQIKLIKQYINEDKTKILELGPGNCNLLLKLKNKYNCEVYGIEINKKICELAKLKGIDVLHGTFEKIYKGFKENSFDIIYMSHFLEHATHPRKTISVCRKLLKNKGYIICEIPNIDAMEFKIFKRYWGLIHAPRHISFFTPKTLKFLFGSEGFRIKKFNSELATFSWALSMQNLIRDKFFRLSKNPRELYYPLLLIGFLPITLFQSIFYKTGIISFAAIKR